MRIEGRIVGVRSTEQSVGIKVGGFAPDFLNILPAILRNGFHHFAKFQGLGQMLIHARLAAQGNIIRKCIGRHGKDRCR